MPREELMVLERFKDRKELRANPVSRLELFSLFSSCSRLEDIEKIVIMIKCRKPTLFPFALRLDQGKNEQEMQSQIPFVEVDDIDQDQLIVWCLTHSPTKNFRLFQTERFFRQQYSI